MPDGGLWREWEPESVAALKANVLSCEEAALDALAFPPPLNPAEWAEAHIRFPEGTPAAGPYRNSTSPYLRELLEVCSPDHPAQHVVVIKCAQSGGTVAADLMLSSILSSQTAAGMMIQPTISQAKEWAENKFWPMAEASPTLAPDDSGAVLPRLARSDGGSTAQKIRFRNGSWLMLAGAESPNTLRQHTIQFMVRDDISGWTDNSGGEGHPLSLSDKRVAICLELGIAKVLDNSTPLILRGCAITRKYEASDRRRFYMGCLGCEARIDWDWEDVQKNAEAPFDAHLVCPECGQVHAPADKRDMLARGMWIATRPYQGEKPPKVLATEAEAQRWKTRDMGPWAIRPGFHITGVINRYSNWNTLAEEEAAIKGDPEREKTFLNLSLGRPYDIKTETPDWEALSSRRTLGFHQGQGSWGPLVFTLTVDVQRDGLYWLVKGWDSAERGWYLDWGYAAGETSEVGRGAWPKLTAIAERGAPLPGGAHIGFDFIGVDGRYNTDAVHAWVKRQPLARVLVGDHGWGKPIINKTTQAEISRTGKRRKFGIKVWHVGTWPAKQVLVTRYARTLEKVTESGPAPGVCIFPAEADEALFQQLTAEYLAEEEIKSTGMKRQIWKARGDNHWFDCDVMSLAGLDFLGARAGRRGSWTEEQWLEREHRIEALVNAQGAPQDDLFERKASAASPASDTGERRSPGSVEAALQKMARNNRGDS